ncbi:helix-turn-helix domain-containing protein [Streptomyces marianii]|uniref:helix-turn-helix domain-containing protein n=1 Tax=Streptomyces marianii TaxID=1817406 RepID=UPI001487476E|nr:helix-turn-helix transcriptional regulator [Streptomyces marianii]
MPTTSDLTAERRVAFGRRLREVRERAGLTQTAAAKAAGLDRSFYAEVESARHSVSVDRLYAIADALGVSVHELLPDNLGRPVDE